MLRFFKDNSNSLEGNAIVYGPCATGKTEQFIKPNILAMAKRNEANLIIFDANKGLHRQMESIIKNNGYQCIVINSLECFNSLEEKIARAYIKRKLCIFIEVEDFSYYSNSLPIKITDYLLSLNQTIPTYFFFDEFQFTIDFDDYINNNIINFNKHKIYYVICLQSFESRRRLSYDKFNILFFQYPVNFFDKEFIEAHFSGGVLLLENLKKIDRTHAILISGYNANNFAVSERLSRVLECPLKNKRIWKGLSQNELADLSHVAIRNIEDYEQNPEKINYASCNNVFKLAKVLDCSIEDLMVF